MPTAAVHSALSLSGKVQEYGGWAGFAAVLGLGVLSMLYFAQSREVKRLREWAGRAPERAIELEQQRAGVQAPGHVVPQPVPRPAAVTPVAQPAGAAVGAHVAAPAARASVGAAVAAAVTAAGATASADGAATGAVAPAVAAGAMAMAPVATVPAASAPVTAAAASPVMTPGNGAGSAAAVPPPPAVTPAAAAASGSPVRPPQPLRTGSPQATPPPRTPAAAANARAASAFAPGRTGGPHSTLRRVLPIIAGVLLVAIVAVVVASTVFGGGSKKAGTPNSVGQQPIASTSGSQAKKSATATTKKFVPSDVTVTVLNGTTISGLAAQETNKLAQAGFKTNQPTNDTTNQTRSATAVFYMPNNRAAALVVAKELGVATDAVQPIDPSTRLLVNPNAQQVVVSLGSDQGQ